MRRSASAISLFFLLLGMSFAAFAANHAVNVGGGGLTFTPASLTIAAGDTVTFTNAGGFHNVVANDGSFRCADNCTATGGNANSSAWSSVVTYNAAGTFGYYCEIHGGPGAGMHGSITVEAAPPPPPPAGTNIGGYLSGNWYNPAQSGSGFQLEVTSNFGQMLAIWFVYKPDGSGQQWIFAQGSYDSTSSTVTLPAVIIQNGKFPFPLSNYVASDIQKTSWGTVTFSFSDCNTGVASWDSTLPGFGSGSVPITRLTQIAGTVCP